MMVSRRHALLGAASLALGPLAAPFSTAFATNQAGASPNITAKLIGNDKILSREDVLRYEAQRLAVVWKLLRHRYVGFLVSELDSLFGQTNYPITNIAQCRSDLLELKLKLGSAKLMKILGAQLALSDAIGKAVQTSVNHGSWRPSIVDISCDQGSAAGFVEWFFGLANKNDEAAMLVANPDHYVVSIRNPGSENMEQNVVETPGGSPVAMHFHIVFSDLAENPIAKDASLPYRIIGEAEVPSSGKLTGWASHQFADTPGGGFHGRLTIAYPPATPSFIVRGHEYHLACEFSNWIEAYLGYQPRYS